MCLFHLSTVYLITVLASFLFMNYFGLVQCVIFFVSRELMLRGIKEEVVLSQILFYCHEESRRGQDPGAENRAKSLAFFFIGFIHFYLLKCEEIDQALYQAENNKQTL